MAQLSNQHLQKPNVRKTDITMLTSVGKPDLELAANSMAPMIIEAIFRKLEKPTSNSTSEKENIDAQ